MKALGQLLREIHRRWLWQVLVMYLVVAVLIFQVIQTLIATRSLPSWFTVFALALLIIGLPIVLITAYVQEGMPALTRPGSRATPDARGGLGEPPSTEILPEPRGPRRIFTWQNAIMYGAAAFTLWAVVAVAWLLLT